MGLLRFLRRLLFGAAAASPTREHPPTRSQRRRRVRLHPLRRTKDTGRLRKLRAAEVDELPYRFAPLGARQGRYLDLSGDGDDRRLAEFGLPAFHTPEELARWLELPLGRLAWLTGRFSQRYRPPDERSAHYHFEWRKKRRGGWRLIEAPKSTLKAVQRRIAAEVLAGIPPHPAAHGFVPGCSVLSNARPHVGRRVLVGMDLENFYATVSFNRVAAIFRSVGYSREAALWLARLTTSSLPPRMRFPQGDASALWPYMRRHLPQGAPTSPALANLSAYGLDVRLSGMSRAFGAQYTRYADDLTFSGDGRLIRSLPIFLPLVTQIIRAERFQVNRRKRRVIRSNRRQTVTGVVVNDRPNVSRREYERLKAILHNCVRFGPSSQNREAHADFAAHLRGRIAWVSQLHPERGARLLATFGQIDWRR